MQAHDGSSFWFPFLLIHFHPHDSFLLDYDPPFIHTGTHLQRHQATWPYPRGPSADADTPRRPGGPSSVAKPKGMRMQTGSGLLSVE